MIKKATQVGDPVIRTKTKEVSDINDTDVKKVIDDLIDSMRDLSLVGMAAPQVGSPYRIFVTEIKKTPYRKDEDLDELRVFINPEIIARSEDMAVEWEGCGSVAEAGLFAQVERPASVTIKALDQDGEEFVHEAQGLLAVVIQHELDHLNGVLFIDKADLQTAMSRSEYFKMRSK